MNMAVGGALEDEWNMGGRERRADSMRDRTNWSGGTGRLELCYSALSDQFRAFQPVTVAESR
jgi:putative transposase